MATAAVALPFGLLLALPALRLSGLYLKGQNVAGFGAGYLGVDVFFHAGDRPVTLVFLGLTMIYLIEIPTRFLSWSTGGRLVGLFQVITGIWLLYCTYSTVTHLALGAA